MRDRFLTFRSVACYLSIARQFGVSHWKRLLDVRFPDRTGALSGLVCVLVGFVLRARVYARNLPFWYDESYLLLNVADVPFAGLCGALDYNLVIPALFLWLERACFLAFGMTEWGMRLPAFVAGLLAVVVVVAPARRVVGGPLWWLPVALLALSRHAIGHGAEVRPYTVDLFLSALILWSIAVVLAEGRGRRPAAGVLLLTAALGPWVSFPSAFGLAGAIGALFVAAGRRGGFSRWARVVAVAVVAGSSSAALWAVQARHLYYPGMQQHWGPSGWGGFPDPARPWSVLLWPLTRSVEAGNYGTREMGVALTALALIGAVVLARRNSALAVAVVLPFVAALTASLLGKYPLADRTTTFLLPGLWMTAAVGAAALVARFSGRRFAIVLALGLLGPDLVNDVKNAFRPTPPGTREVFAHIRAARADGDILWDDHVEVYRTYFGREGNVSGACDAPARVIASARTGRIWVVVRPAPLPTPADEMIAALKADGFRETERCPYHGIVVSLYAR